MQAAAGARTEQRRWAVQEGSPPDVGHSEIISKIFLNEFRHH